jgi:hypothetical protein
MKQTKAPKKQPDNKAFVSARIDQSIIDHCSELANNFNWSLTQVISLAMGNITREDILKTFENGKQL